MDAKIRRNERRHESPQFLTGHVRHKKKSPPKRTLS